MRYKKLGTTDLNVSVVSLGTWPMSNQFWGGVDDKDSIATIQCAIDHGINLIDSAPCYGNGHAEEVMGKAIAGRRDKVVVATKCGLYRNFADTFCNDLRPIAIRKELDDSLRRIGVDVIDLYQIHKPDPETPLEVTMEELRKQQKAGKIRYIGVSNFDTALTAEAGKYATIDSIQPRYSLLSRADEGYIKASHQHNIGVLSFGSLDGGLLSGKYTKPPQFGQGDMRKNFYHYFEEPMFSKFMELQALLRQMAEKYGKPVSQVSINWVAQQPYMTSALVGAKTPEQIAQNAGAGEWELSDADLKAIDEAQRRIFG